MITFLEGTLEEKQPTRIVMNVGGVGYEVLIPLSSYDRLGLPQTKCRIRTYHMVREDNEVLYGFCTEAERNMFELLLTISGIGPRIALNALNGLTLRELKVAVKGNDIKRLSSISGIGKKTAERIIIELRDKISEGEALEAMSGDDAAPEDLRGRDAVLALISLGYKQADAQKMVRQVRLRDPNLENLEEIVRKSLAPQP